MTCLVSFGLSNYEFASSDDAPIAGRARGKTLRRITHPFLGREIKPRQPLKLGTPDVHLRSLPRFLAAAPVDYPAWSTMARRSLRGAAGLRESFDAGVIFMLKAVRSIGLMIVVAVVWVGGLVLAGIWAAHLL